MEVAVVGVNHNKTPIDIRERLNFMESQKIEATELLLDRGLEEVVILSTCNRSEIYFTSVDVKKGIETVKLFFETYFRQENCASYLFEKEEEEAVKHLCHVCLGVDSVVVGEDQILGQVKEAMRNAIELKSSGKILNQMFRNAVTVAKKVKSETKLSENPLSLSYIGVKKLKREISELKNAKVLLIGLGKMGLLALKHLETEGVRQVILCNRKYGKSLEIQSDYPFCKVEEYANLQEVISDVDIVISATASPHIIVFKHMLKNRRSPLYLLDLALPRDIAENVGELEGVILYNIDSLKAVSEENIKERTKLLSEKEKDISEAIREFMTWKSKILLDPVIRSLNERCTEIKRDTLSYIYRKVPLEHRHKKVIDKMVESALKRMLREPILNLKQMEEEEKAQQYMDMLNRLFELRS